MIASDAGSTIRVCVIRNQAAGQATAKASAIDDAVQLWRLHGWDVDEYTVHQAGDAHRYAQTAVAAAYSLVVAAGGDGTVNEVANALVGSSVVLAPLPAGTVNVWAREAGYSMDIREAALQILNGNVIAMDVGVMGERHFVLMAGIGFDAEVVRYLYPNAKRKFGVLAYIGRIWSVVWGYRARHVTVELDDETFDVDLLIMVVGNTPKYASFIPFTPHARVHDGFLDVTMMTGPHLLTGPMRFLALYIRRWAPWLDSQVITRRVKHIRITGPAMAVQFDGDYIGTTPCEISVIPQALQVLVHASPAP